MDSKIIQSVFPADISERRLRNGGRFVSGLFRDNVASQKLGDPVGIAGSQNVVLVEQNSRRWEDSPGFDKVWNRIEQLRKKLANSIDRDALTVRNAADFPSDYYELINLLRLDLTRRRVEAADMTGMMAQESTNLNASKSIEIVEFLPFVGAFEEIKGRGEAIPMVQHRTGDKTSVSVVLYALGDARTLEDELFNLDIYSLQKANDAIVRAHIAKRNDLVIGPMLAAAYSGTQAIAADATGSTYQERLYNTIDNAIEALRIRLDPQTRQTIDASRMVLMTAYADERKINRVINGQLDNAKGKAANLQALTEIVEIWPYKGDTITVGDRVYEYDGVDTGTAYLFVPGKFNAPNFVVNKRPLTYEAGGGNALNLIRDGRVAYFGQAEYADEFLGAAADGGVAETGYVVEITLPAA